MRSGLGWVLVGLSAAGALLVGNRLLAVPDRAPAATGQLEAPVLESAVKIVRDPLGVPHVEARSEADALFGLGVAHAQDRLWQMELARRAATGRLSEMFGHSTLASDRLARTLGIGRDAEREAEALGPETARRLEAYAAGVNRWLEEIAAGRAATPIELERLDLTPEPWRPADSLALVRFRAWALSRSLGSSLLLDQLVREIGLVASQEFFPAVPKRPRDDLARLDPSLFNLHRIASQWIGSVGLNGPVGSSGFVVGARASRSGRPLLANDPHVELSTPAAFYLAHVYSPSFEAAGATSPGIPVFWTGTNGTIAWGQVSLFASTSELYEETLHPSDPSRYGVGGGWRPVEKRKETIDVRDGGAVEIEVVSTRHGPLLQSVDPNDAALFRRALQWAGQGPKSGIEVAFGVERSSSWNGFRAALRDLAAPAATFLYADADGDAGTQVAGHLPIRTLPTNLLPVDGGSRSNDWRGYIPFDALPRRHGDDLAIVIASPHPSGGAFPHPVAWLWHDTRPEKRLAQRLRQARPVDLREVVAIQRERVSTTGPARVKTWLEGVEARTQGATRLQRILREWDGSTGTESAGAAAYHAFRVQLARRLLSKRLDPHLVEALRDVAEPVPGALLERYLAQLEPKAARAIAADVLEETWSWFGSTLSSNPERWTWGEVHRIHLEHAFERFGAGGLAWRGRKLGIGPVGAPGDPDSIWAMYSTPTAPFEARVGPGLRFAIDMRDPGHPWVGLAGGQSGHPGSPHYADALEDWLRGEPRPLWMHASDVAYHEAGVWTLSPARP